ncbi:MAG: SH3 domain-containing protein [Anaerolineales bacterium]|nr:SH3 domain-containing protein [Anaerolineales bacterium]
MYRNLKVQWAISVLLILAIACNISSTPPAESEEPEVITIVVTATESTDASITEEPNEATATLNQDLNVRGGPGTAYPIVTALPGGSIVNIIGKNADGSWWLITLDGGKSGWISAPFTSSSNTENVPIVEAPPPQPNSSGDSGGSSGSDNSGGSGGSGGSGNSGGGGDSGGGGQTASSDNDIQATINIKNGSINQSNAVSYPNGDTMIRFLLL